MDLQKTKIYLDKLHREYARLSKDPDNIARIDVDIMASYVRELYDALLSESGTYTHKTEPAPVRKPAVVKPPEPEERPAAAVPPPPPPVVVVQEPAPTPHVPPPPPPAEEKPAPAPPPPVEPKPQPVAASKSTDPSLGAAELLFEERQAKELSDKLSEMPIPDLKKAIALNDRLLLTRELFAGDGQAFESAIAVLNGLTHFDDARSYLQEHCVVRYGWLDKKRIEEAKNFIRLVRRRYK